MKKLLSLLSVLTISGTAIPTTTAASPYQKEETIKNSNINYSQINNLEKLMRVKRANDNKLERIKTKTYANLLKIKISHSTWANIQFLHNNQSASEFKNSIISILNGFEKSVASGTNYIDDSDMTVMYNTIINHYDRINDVFKGKNDDTRGLLLITDRNGYWAYPWSPNWGGDYGAFVN